MAKNLIMIACIFLFALVAGWMWIKNYDKKASRLTEAEKEFGASIIELLKRMNDFTSPIDSEDYHARVFSAILANKILLIDARLNPHFYNNQKISDYEESLKILLGLETNKINSLHQRRVICHLLKFAVQ